MKQRILVLSLALCSFSQGIAQDLTENAFGLLHQEADPYIINTLSDCKRLSNGHYLACFQRWYRIEENGEAIISYQELDSAFSKVLLLDDQLQVLKTHLIPSTTDDYHLKRASFVFYDDALHQYIIYGEVISNEPFSFFNYTTRHFFTILLDENFEKIGEYAFGEAFDFTVYFQNVILNRSGNLIITGDQYLGSPLTDSYIVEYTRYGELIAKKVWEDWSISGIDFVPSNAPALIQFEPSGHYHAAHNGLSILHYDENLNFLEHYTTGLGASLIRETVPINDSVYLVGGKFGAELLYRVNKQGQLELIYQSDEPFIGENSFTGQHTLAAIDTNHIYFGNQHGCDLFDCEAFVSLRSIRSDGTLNWSRFLGDPDFAYTPQKIIATPDTGCLYLVNKCGYFPEFGFYTCRPYFLKIDKDGNLQTITSIDDTTPTEMAWSEVLVYPNPASNYLYIEHGQQYQALSITFYNTLGAQLWTQSVNAQQMDISHLPSGACFYTLREKEQVIQSGTLLIKR
ncbi:MAG TPA: T9SS type A sorting domain-containing protein [Saprospiraceae bacterium]|nr:T9SS type A sorting domain-containing protein [Saprospiraceae bacterium]HMQ83133.1 T9SS type A sorting domain-containing protein [Saprospiraceae bacterium]